MYSAVFETIAGYTVDDVVMLESESTTALTDVLSRFTAIDLTKLVTDNLSPKQPDGVGDGTAFASAGADRLEFCGGDQ